MRDAEEAMGDVGGLALDDVGGVRGRGRSQEGYPDCWPLVARLVKALSRNRCEHCRREFPASLGAREGLTVHHLDRNHWNLQHWNLVPLCLPCHGLVERQVELGREQLDLLPEAVFPWLTERRRDRQRWPWAGRQGQLEDERQEPEELFEEQRRRDGGGPRGCARCGRRLGVDADPRRRWCSRACQQAAHRERKRAQLVLSW